MKLLRRILLDVLVGVMFRLKPVTSNGDEAVPVVAVNASVFVVLTTWRIEPAGKLLILAAVTASSAILAVVIFASVIFAVVTASSQLRSCNRKVGCF